MRLLTLFFFYVSIVKTLYGDEGKNTFQRIVRELPGAVRQYDVKRALVPEPVSGNGSIETRTHRYML